MTVIEQELEMFTASEVAEITGLSLKRINSLFDRGILVGCRFPGPGGRRITRASLEAFLANIRAQMEPNQEDQ